MSLLEDLYYGKICPSERSHSNDPKYALYSKQISELLQILKEKLTPDDFTMVEGVMDLNDMLISVSSAAAYILGFRMGAAMIIEVLGHKEELIHTEEVCFGKIKLDGRES
ncbi:MULTISPECIES: DUF6809 family protein [Paenibacillus]|uniref:DUF6809 family protein n=1 Tax=Paenibacillus TaxID=44249 RepID=UPI0009FA6543|nr:DUF6809 family protein [Paenibacillus borealis]